MAKKVYAVDLISTSIQTKLVLASSKKEAYNIASETEWLGKEEIIDTQFEAREAVIKGDEKEGGFPDFYPSSYVHTDDGDCKRYNEIVK